MNLRNRHVMFIAALEVVDGLICLGTLGYARPDLAGWGWGRILK